MTPFEAFKRSGVVSQKIDIPLARFAIGAVVRHKMFDFRGVIFDVDPVFANSEEWYEAIPEALRPSKDQPFYHLLAENAETTYVAYVSQQNLVADESDEPVDHPAIASMFNREDGRYQLRRDLRN
ncbi:MAG: heat shock protein HspQ [Sphingomicrobium sp.]